MKEELIKYVMEKADKLYSDDFPILNIETWIRDFFDQYQPERLNPEDHIADVGKLVCDSPNSENK